jgi:hypothetical protein
MKITQHNGLEHGFVLWNSSITLVSLYAGWFGPHGRFGRHESSYDGCVALETKA